MHCYSINLVAFKVLCGANFSRVFVPLPIGRVPSAISLWQFSSVLYRRQVMTATCDASNLDAKTREKPRQSNRMHLLGRNQSVRNRMNVIRRAFIISEMPKHTAKHPEMLMRFAIKHKYTADICSEDFPPHTRQLSLEREKHKALEGVTNKSMKLSFMRGTQ